MDIFDPGAAVELAQAEEQDLWHEIDNTAAGIFELSVGASEVTLFDRAARFMSTEIPTQDGDVRWLTVGVWGDRLSPDDALEISSRSDRQTTVEQLSPQFRSDPRSGVVASTGSHMTVAITGPRPGPSDLRQLALIGLPA